ncbi:MAG: hypothetical protein CMN94_07410 [Synechococcus sp. EAC657]|nr:hypothetical protein [Synechococcus sp. EAC657]
MRITKGSPHCCFDGLAQAQAEAPRLGDRFKLVQQLCEQIQGDGSSEVDVCSRGVCGIGCV